MMGGQQREAWSMQQRDARTDRGWCFSSARMASLALRSYFLSRSSPLEAWMSRRGLPMQTRIGDMAKRR